MNRIHTVVSSAVLAALMAGGAAFAADEASKQPAAGNQATQAGQQGELGAGPNVRDLDSNAQRAHSPTGQTGATTSGDRMGADAPSTEDLDATAQRAHERPGGSQDSAAGTDAGANKSTAEGTGSTGADTNIAASGDTRDWSAIDTNNDNLISPEEMEAALANARQQR